MAGVVERTENLNQRRCVVLAPLAQEDVPRGRIVWWRSHGLSAASLRLSIGWQVVLYECKYTLLKSTCLAKAKLARRDDLHEEG